MTAIASESIVDALYRYVSQDAWQAFGHCFYTFGPAERPWSSSNFRNTDYERVCWLGDDEIPLPLYTKSEFGTEPDHYDAGQVQLHTSSTTPSSLRPHPIQQQITLPTELSLPVLLFTYSCLAVLLYQYKTTKTIFWRTEKATLPSDLTQAPATQSLQMSSDSRRSQRMMGIPSSLRK